MATKVLVPRLGEGVDELTVVKWLKTEGSPVKELESLLEVETDKVVTEIPSPAAGVVLKILVPENTSAQVGEIMAWIGQAGESIPAPAAQGTGKPAARVEAQDQVEKHPSTSSNPGAESAALRIYISGREENCR